MEIIQWAFFLFVVVLARSTCTYFVKFSLISARKLHPSDGMDHFLSRAAKLSAISRRCLASSSFSRSCCLRSSSFCWSFSSSWIWNLILAVWHDTTSFCQIYKVMTRWISISHGHFQSENRLNNLNTEMDYFLCQNVVEVGEPTFTVSIFTCGSDRHAFASRDDPRNSCWPSSSCILEIFVQNFSTRSSH